VAGKPVPVQKIGDQLCAEVVLPPCGWTTVHNAPAKSIAGRVNATTRRMENEFLAVTFNGLGEIVSWVDKETGAELAKAPMNSFRMYKDVPRAFDAWDIDSTYEFLPVALPAKAELEVVTQGALDAVLRLRRRLHDSALTQEITLRHGSRRLEFRCRIDWREKHKLLKVNFPSAIHANEGIHEVQFGHLRRPNHSSRPFDADRFEVSNHKWTALAEENRGVAVLNDCKYGVDVDGGSINLTLLRAPQAPDMTADQGIQEFAYAFVAWNGSFFASNLVREAYELNAPVLATAGDGGTRSLFAVDAANVVIETVKPAEDGSGDIVVRLYEAKRSASRCRLTTSLPVSRAIATDMLEQGGRPVAVKDGVLVLTFRPFEVKTLRLICRPKG
jgi:alpha-mannosidase